MDKHLDKALNLINMAMGLIPLGKAHDLLNDAEWELIKIQQLKKKSENEG